MNTQNAAETNEENQQRLVRYLQREDVQGRIRARMRSARENATVTISRAAKLFGFSEQQLRDWEKRGLLKTERPVSPAQEEGKSTQGHRQYAPEELDKLALIKELLDEGDFAPGEIPVDIKTLWSSLDNEESQPFITTEQARRIIESQLADLPIDQRIEAARDTLFWRYFISHVLRLALLLIHEDNLGTYVGLILPFQKNVDALSIHTVNDLENVGESLVGWLGQSLSSHTLLTAKPSFRYETDFSIVPLRSVKSDVSPLDSTLVVLKRGRDANFRLSEEAIETICTLLRPIYENVERSRVCFGLTMNDALESAPDVSNIALYPDLLLNGLANIIVQLGGSSDTPDRWLFSCILASEQQSKPLQQRSLVVLAQSEKSPYTVGVTDVIPDEADLNSLSLRAFQSGRIAYRPIVLPKDAAVAHWDQEPTVRSAVGIPIGGEDGEPVAALYVASEHQDAFTEHDRRVLRMMGRLIEEILRTFSVRQREGNKLRDIIRQVDDVDTLFSGFLSENQFIADVEETLARIKSQTPSQKELDAVSEPFENQQEEEQSDVLSIIAIDVDNTGEYAAMYGDQMVRNLCREVGLRIKGELNTIFEKYTGRLYHIYADRFYVVLWDTPLNTVEEKALLLKESISLSYKVSVLPASDIQVPSPGTMKDVDKVTVRFVVSSYSAQTIEDLLGRYPRNISIPTLRQTIERALTAQLKKGMDRGGNRIIAWDPQRRGYKEL